MSVFGAAALPLLLAHPGYVPGNYYSTWPGTNGSTGAVGAADRLYLYPFLIAHPVRIDSLFLRVITIGTASAAKLGIWRNRAGRPTGAPVVADNTGVSTAAQGVASASVTPTLLAPGVYWAGTKHTGSGLPVCTNIVGTSTLASFLMGSSAAFEALQNGATNQMSAIYTASPYAEDMPDLTGAAFTALTGANPGVPILGIGVAS